MPDFGGKRAGMMGMVGIVLVSHSVDLANGLRQLLIQVHPEVPIAVAAGTDEGEIGTSYLKIQDAVESVYTDQGVIIFFDLGSSFMNTEIALEQMPDKQRIRIADAPMVEGAYVAVVESGCGRSLEEVLEAAQAVKDFPKYSS